MKKHDIYQNIVNILTGLLQLPLILSGFAQHLALHFGRSFSNHSYRYAFSNEQPNCCASYSANSGSLMKYPGSQVVNA